LNPASFLAAAALSIRLKSARTLAALKIGAAAFLSFAACFSASSATFLALSAALTLARRLLASLAPTTASRDFAASF